jgi:hypothetical protein
VIDAADESLFLLSMGRGHPHSRGVFIEWKDRKCMPDFVSHRYLNIVCLAVAHVVVPGA